MEAALVLIFLVAAMSMYQVIREHIAKQPKAKPTVDMGLLAVAKNGTCVITHSHFRISSGNPPMVFIEFTFPYNDAVELTGKASVCTDQEDWPYALTCAVMEVKMSYVLGGY